VKRDGNGRSARTARARSAPRATTIDMVVSQLTVDPFTNMPIVILKDGAGVEALPIWIGLAEAGAIATELEKIALDRPMTHDLMKRIIGECGVKVERVEVHDVRGNTFYAAIHLSGPPLKRGGTRALDCRPSDAIALALRTGARICVARKVLERMRRINLGSPASEGSGAPATAAQLKQLLENLSDDEFGKWKM
jgi:bifunctional DNase/RNase